MNCLTKNIKSSDPNDLTLIGHLSELRYRIIVALCSALIGFIAAMTFSEQLIDLAVRPLQQALPQLQPTLLSVTESFVTTIKLALWAGFVVSSPIFLWQLWAFVSPALNSSEQKWASFMLLPAIACFFLGMAFCWHIILPPAISLLITANNTHFVPMISYAAYVDFVVNFTLIMGMLFELPLLLTFLDAAKILPLETIAERRKDTIVVAFILGAIFSPPDVVSQILASLPIIALTELGIWLSKLRRSLCRRS